MDGSNLRQYRAPQAREPLMDYGAGAWMEVLPVEPELTMSDEAYDAAFCHRFLLRNDRLVHSELTRACIAYSSEYS